MISLLSLQWLFDNAVENIGDWGPILRGDIEFVSLIDVPWNLDELNCPARNGDDDCGCCEGKSYILKLI